MALTTLTDLKTLLGLTGTADDAILTQVRDAADGYVEAYCGRTFAGGTFTEFHPGGGRTVFLRNYPVTAVASVKVDPNEMFGIETTLPADRYTLLADRGVIVAKGGRFVSRRPGFPASADDFPRAVRVEYSTATDAVPPAVARAACDLAAHWFRQARTAASMGQLNLLSDGDPAAPTTYPWGQAGGFRVPVVVHQLLSLYRVPAA